MGLEVFINGKKEDVEAEMSVQKLLELKKIRPEVVTVEHNDRILDRSKYNETILKERDRIEFVYYMGGGSTHDPAENREGRSLTTTTLQNKEERHAF